jgi:hypothetical protein
MIVLFGRVLRVNEDVILLGLVLEVGARMIDGLK